MNRILSILLASLLVLASQGVLAEKIDINNADAVTLSGLNGIGEAKAEAIVDHRRTNGPFRTVDELARVRGIGFSIVDRNRDRITVDGTVEAMEE